MRERLTDLLDAAGLILLGLGLGCETTGWLAVFMRVGFGRAVAAAGMGVITTAVVLLVGSWIAARPVASGGDE